MKTIKLSLAAAMAAAVATTGASANMLEEIISNPQLDIEIRPRYEYVDQDNNLDSAKALTVRTAIGVKMGLLGVEGLNAQLQGMSVDHFGLVTDYAPESAGYSVVADPAQTRMTQANISYTYEGFTGIVGRKMVVLDNARFIGNVGWRQMPQTYDLVAGIYNWEGLNLLAAYVTQVNRIFAGDAARLDTNSILLHATYTFMPELTVTAYDYMISNFADHIGIRATGKLGFEGFSVKYEAEYAMQNDPTMDDKDEPLYTTNDDQDADYYKVGVDAMIDAFTAGIAYEVLGEADGGRSAFSTPLATLHAHNGWADQFLATPDEGLCDLSVKLAYNFGEYGKLLGVYHAFTSDTDNASGDDDLGDEIDVAYNYQITKGLGLLLKGAWYSAGDDSFGKVDTDKYWVQFDYKFHTEL
jgi:hypothetical protein